MITWVTRGDACEVHKARSEVEIEMKKPDKSQTSERKAQKPLPTHKELVAQIAEENRAYFDKKDAATGPKMGKKKYPHQYPHPEAARSPIMTSETGTTHEEQTAIDAKTVRRLLGKNKAFRLLKDFGAPILVTVLIAGLVVEFGYIGVSILNDVAKHPAKPAAPNLGFDRFEE